MTDTQVPERIWLAHTDYDSDYPDKLWSIDTFDDGGTEYIRRADLCASKTTDNDTQAGLSVTDAPQPSGWQPIETVPRDGSKFWGKDGDDAIAMLWHKEFGEFVSTWHEMTFAPKYGGGTRLHSPTVHRPKHWMPLPESPAGKAGA